MNRLKCFFLGHDVTIIRPVSRQTALVRCRRCEGLFAAKMEGDCKGHLMPWRKARGFYTTFPGSFPHVRPGFVERMNLELVANAHKGDWHAWKPTEEHIISEVRHHFHKMEIALLERDPVKVSEYAADVANLVMKADEVHGEASRDHQVPYAYCCNGDPATCDCVHPNHGTAAS